MVRGGGETRRKTAIAIALSLTITLMLTLPVSADTSWTKTYDDQEGDLWMVWTVPGKVGATFMNSHTGIVKAGYFDMVSLGLSQTGDDYTFKMTVAKDLPQPGDKLPNGLHAARWVMWIDTEPWLTGGQSLYTVGLFYEDGQYSAKVIDYPTWETLTSLEFRRSGSSLEVDFSAGDIGGYDFTWWQPGVVINYGPLGTWGQTWVDALDPGVANGQVDFDIPWPPV